MRVTTDDSGTGESETLLWADDVDDALTTVAHTEIGQTELLDIVFESSDLCS